MKKCLKRCYVFLMCCSLLLVGCQNQNIQVTCEEKNVKYISDQQDELDFSSLLDSHLYVEHGDIVKISLEKSDDVKVIEYLLNEDGSQKYTKGFPIDLLEGDEVSFEVKFSFSDLLSSQELSPDNPSLRGYVVSYDGGTIMFVLETNVGVLESE